MTKQFEWVTHFGGLLLTRIADGATVLVQPGDDAAILSEVLDNTTNVYTDDHAIAEYFPGDQNNHHAN